MAEDFVIEMLHITKEFPGIKANDDITLQLRKGRGTRPAGRKRRRQKYADERAVRPVPAGERVRSARMARRSPSATPTMQTHWASAWCTSTSSWWNASRVLDNIILGVEPNKMGFLQKAEARKKVMALSEKYGLRVDPDALDRAISRWACSSAWRS